MLGRSSPSGSAGSKQVEAGEGEAESGPELAADVEHEVRQCLSCDILRELKVPLQAPKKRRRKRVKEEEEEEEEDVEPITREEDVKSGIKEWEVKPDGLKVCSLFFVET